MTMPHELTRTIIQTRQFLLDIYRGEYAALVPEEIRTEARRLLRHYPDAATVSGIARFAPTYLCEPTGEE